MNRIAHADLADVLDRTSREWRELSGGRVFMTGCTGFFGVWILECLLAAVERWGLSFNVTILSRNPEAFLSAHPQFEGVEGLDFLRGDVRTFPFPEGCFSHVIHGATTRANETFFHEPPMSKFLTVAMGTLRVLDFCVEKKVAGMLYVGSGAACAAQANDMPLLQEDCLLAPETMNPDAALGHAKRTAEFFCAAYGREHNLRVKMTRCFSFVGPHLPLDIHYAVGNFIRDGMDGRAIRVTGDGCAVRSFLYMSDLVVWLLTILFRGEPLRIYNVGSEDARTIAEVATMVGRSFAPAVPVVISSSSPSAATSAPSRYVPSTLRVRSELGLEQTVSLADGIRRTIDFHLRDKRAEL